MSDPIIEQVRSQYGAAAVGGLSSDHAGVRAVAGGQAIAEADQ